MPTSYVRFPSHTQVIARFGQWLYNAMYKSYLLFFKPEGLLAVAGWEGAAQKNFNTFWSP